MSLHFYAAIEVALVASFLYQQIRIFYMLILRTFEGFKCLKKAKQKKYKKKVIKSA